MGGTDVHLDLVNQSLNTLDAKTIQVINQAAYVTCFSDVAQQILLAIHPKWQEKIKIIPQGVVIPAQTDNHYLELRTELSSPTFSSDSLHVLLPAGLREVKDVLQLLPAWKMLDQKFENFKVTIVGEALDKQIYQQVMEACRTHAFLKYQSSVPFDQMSGIYQKCDVVLNTSKQEGQPTAICEAMALGIPVIARNNPGNRAVLEHGVTGFLYDTPEQFYSLVTFMVDQPQKIKRIIEDAKRFIREERSWAKEMDAYVSLCNKIFSISQDI